MKRIQDLKLLHKYIEKYQLQQHFSNELASMSELLSFACKESLFRQGEHSDHLLFLLNGQVKIYSYLDSGYLLNLRYYTACGQVFGEVESLWGHESTSSILALSPCLCLAVSITKYQSILLDDNRFLRFLAQSMAERLSSNHSIAAPPEIRLASFLLRVSTSDIFSFNLTECASILNISNRHLFRILKRMCDQKILQKNPNGYKILSPDLLAKMQFGQYEL